MKNGVKDWGNIKRQIVSCIKSQNDCIDSKDYGVAEYWKGWIKALEWATKED